MELNVTSQTPSPISFVAQKEKSNSLQGLTKTIQPRSNSKRPSHPLKACALTPQESSAIGRLFRPLKTFIKESLNLPLSQAELANKVKEFALSPACQALAGPSLNTQQIYSLAMKILNEESVKARSLTNRAHVGNKSSGLNLF